ncbi:hypothetical protein [Flavobacterium defluvii]|uniref:Uncharacterized protein n=1 Tax=Flavobacterium defluvii TaxID=370979 RepID=A0A1M5E733_9FLAO|nr:hypothetical protein [Flavobacterium defluvii]SHF74944.1 hypothetical protein SAMN05443663_10147 [Flavobacterium defluvii]
MGINKITTLEDVKKIASNYLNSQKAITKKTNFHNTEIKVINYYELGCIITNMLKLCILSLDQETNKNSSINLSLILETVLQLFPSDELEFLDKINELITVEFE